MEYGGDGDDSAQNAAAEGSGVPTSRNGNVSAIGVTKLPDSILQFIVKSLELNLLESSCFRNRW